jgi:hypothetical protein
LGAGKLGPVGGRGAEVLLGLLKGDHFSFINVEPLDRAWIVITEVDGFSSYVGGSRAALQDVLASSKGSPGHAIRTVDDGYEANFNASWSGRGSPERRDSLATLLDRRHEPMGQAHFVVRQDTAPDAGVVIPKATSGRAEHQRPQTSPAGPRSEFDHQSTGNLGAKAWSWWRTSGICWERRVTIS